MTLEERINAFAKLGETILDTYSKPNQSQFWNTISSAQNENPWFTKEFCEEAILSIAKGWLNLNILKDWVSHYPNQLYNPKNPKNIGVVLAGNVPFVGFHDFLCVLISGNNFVGKISSKDGGLMNSIIELLIAIEPRFKNRLTLTEEIMHNFDAIIATGSDNSARYFEYYFGKYPHIIRRNRHSIAILSGNEKKDELYDLAKDIFFYFGLGCRNVSKLLIPVDYDIPLLISSFDSFRYLINHNKYANNYEYYKAIYIMNGTTHLDNGFILLKPDDQIGSPIGVLFYQQYKDLGQVNAYIQSHTNSLQCIVSNISGIRNSIAFGKTQQPKINEFADNIDTLHFLGSLIE